jgi:hypothetical protein
MTTFACGTERSVADPRFVCIGCGGTNIGPSPIPGGADRYCPDCHEQYDVWHCSECPGHGWSAHGSCNEHTNWELNFDEAGT